MELIRQRTLLCLFNLGSLESHGHFRFTDDKSDYYCVVGHRSIVSYHISHLAGGSESDPPLDSFVALYAELEDADAEHTDVSVEHESAWSLGAFRGGLLVWENVEDGEPRHMRNISREDVIRLWRLLAAGDIAAINAEPWRDGYG